MTIGAKQVWPESSSSNGETLNLPSERERDTLRSHGGGPRLPTSWRNYLNKAAIAINF